jgi:hypothetical protein
MAAHASVAGRLARVNVDAHDPVFRGDGLLRRAPKAVESLFQDDALKPDLPEE